MILIRKLRLPLRFSLFCFCALLSIRSNSQVCTTEVYTNSFDLGPPNGEFLLPPTIRVHELFMVTYIQHFKYHHIGGDGYPLVDTSYYVKAEKTPGCFAFDTIRITVYHSAAINLGADLSFCSDDSALLDAGAGFSSYLWNGVSGSQYKLVYSTGEYSVIGITSEGCRSYDTVLTNVWSLPQVDLDHNNELCVAGQILIEKLLMKITTKGLTIVQPSFFAYSTFKG
jgi:hypothetical protein